MGLIQVSFFILFYEEYKMADTRIFSFSVAIPVLLSH